MIGKTITFTFDNLKTVYQGVVIEETVNNVIVKRNKQYTTARIMTVDKLQIISIK